MRGRPDAGGPRRVLIRLESRGRRALALGIAAVLAGVAGWAVARPAVADRLARTADGPEALARAAAWDPGDADLRLRVSDAYRSALDGADPAKARAHAEAALRLRPAHAGAWLRLALTAGDEGRREAARLALETALRLDRHNVSLRWEAALLALRWGDRAAALEHLRYVLAVDPGRRDVAFQLARTLIGPGEPAAVLLPAASEPLAAMLSLALRDRDLALSTAAWERRVALVPPLPAGVQRQYLDLLVEQGEGARARRLWEQMAPAPAPAAPGEAVWNGGFEGDRLLGFGFDWQVQRTWGVEVRLDRFVAASGRQSLRLAFNSFPSLDFSHVSALAAVEPGRDYRLRALVRAQDFVTRSGLKLQVTTADGSRLLAETDAVSGTTLDWEALLARVTVPSGATLVRVRLRREKAASPEGNLGGRVWVDEVTLTPAEAGS